MNHWVPQFANEGLSPSLYRPPLAGLGIQHCRVVSVLDITPTVTEPAQDDMLPTNFVLSGEQSTLRIWHIGRRFYLEFLLRLVLPPLHPLL
jgi:hypothetical protein